MADQHSSPPPTSTPSGSGDPVNDQPASSAGSSLPRYRYGDPFRIIVADQTVTVTGRLILLEPAPPAGQPEPLLLFMESENRQHSSELHHLRNIIDGSSLPVIVHHFHVEQFWMQFQELADPNQQTSTPSLLNVPPPPSIDEGVDPASFPHGVRFGQSFPIDVSDLGVTVTGQEVHLESSEGQRGPSILYVQVLEPIAQTYQSENNGVRLVIFRHNRVERLFLEVQQEPNQNRSDQSPARGANGGPSNQTNNGGENVNESQQVNAPAGNSGVSNVDQAAENHGPSISNQTTGSGDHPSTSNQSNNENGSVSSDQNQPTDGDDDAPVGDN